MDFDLDINTGDHLGPMTARARNFVVVVDDSDESRLALRFATARAGHVEGGGIILFHAIPPGDFQHWVAVAEQLREEEREQARMLLEEAAGKIYAYSGVKPEIVIRDGNPREALLDFMQERDDLFALILASSASGEPGPLVEYFSGPLVANLPCPLVVIPGGLSPETIDRLA